MVFRREMNSRDEQNEKQFSPNEVIEFGRSFDWSFDKMKNNFF